ncbi:MAG: Flp family type IVb pilin [Deltaproteobacteria bacterium]|nr:Flp family type IVb pilin [Deltaproteobacteria bacterium]
MATSIQLFWRDEYGGSAVEYSIILGFIAMVVITGITALGNSVLNRLYTPVVSMFPL